MDDPEKIGRNSNRRKSRNMADAGNEDPQRQQPEEHQEDETGNEDTAAPTEMYLPDLDNTPLSQALKSGLNWGKEDEFMVECPKLKQYFRVDTLLVQRTSGRVRLHTKDEDETFPISCSKTKFPIPLLKKALEGAEQQRATPMHLPGEDWPRKSKIKTYPTPTTNPVNQLITSPIEADKIAEAVQREADSIMAIAFPSGPEPPLAAINTITTQTAQSVPPTAPLANTVTRVMDRLDCRRQLRPTSPAFIMNAIPDNWPEPTTNPLLMVNTGQDGNTNSFITPTLVTNHQNRQGNGNTIALENTIPETDKQINASL